MPPRRFGSKVSLRPSFRSRRFVLVTFALLVSWCLFMTRHISSYISDCDASGGHDCGDVPAAKSHLLEVSRARDEGFDCQAHTPPCTKDDYGDFVSVAECKEAQLLTAALGITCHGGPIRDISTSMGDLFTHLQNADFNEPEYFRKAMPDPAPLVSVIIPVYNAELFLRESVESILRQTYTNIEVLLVDDSSSDESLKVCQELAFEDHRIRILQIPWNRGTCSGPYVAKNYGILESRGTYITYQDSDDVSHPYRLEAQVRFLEVYESTVYVTSNYVRMSTNMAILSNRGDVQRISLQASMFRRYMTKHIGFMDTVKISADAELYGRMIAFYGYSARGIVNLPHATLDVSMPMYYAFKRVGSLTQSAKQGYSLKSTDISADRKTYQDAFTKWHNTPPTERIDSSSGRGFLYMDFPLRSRPFPAPAIHLFDSPFQGQQVVAMMATHKGRVGEFDDAVMSVAPYVDKMFIYLNDMALSEVPKNVRQLTNVEIIQGYEGNIQDNGKFYAIDKIDRNSYVFTVDDDIIYPRDYVQRMVLKIEEYERKAVIGVHCITLTKEQRRYYDDPERRSVRPFQLRLGEDEPAHVLGTGTTAWHASSLPFLSLSDFPSEHVGMADIWLAKHAIEHGMEYKCISRGDSWLQKVKETTPSIWLRYRADENSDRKQTEILRELYPGYIQSSVLSNNDSSSGSSKEHSSSMLEKLFG